MANETYKPTVWYWGVRRLVKVVTIVFLATTAIAQVNRGEPKLRGEGTLKVATYNMYAGTEYAGITDPILENALRAGSNMLADARASEPPLRAKAIAHQIALTMPHLVSLQEVATWSTGPTKDAMAVEFDYLQLLLNALAAEGVHYATAASLTTWDATVPSMSGFVQNSWRVVILARADLPPEDFSITNVQSAKWTATLSFPLPAFNGLPDFCPVPLSGSLCVMPFPRGWLSIDVLYRDKRFRYINAHLESLSASRNIKQSIEMISGPANTTMPVIIAADLNCDISNPADTKYQTCLNLLNAGFMDTWSAANPNDPGYTKPLPDRSMRGDYVLARGRFKAQAAVLIGEDVVDMAAPGLWPSNHCGVVARLQLPGG